MSKAIQRAIKLHNQGHLDKAGEAYRVILAAQPNCFEATHQLGLLRYRQGHYVEALDYLSAALNLKPSDFTALSNYGNVLASLGQGEDALQSYNKALAINPNHVETLYNRGNTLQELKRSEEALLNFDRAISIKQQFAEAHNNRGNALRSLKRPEEALASYDRALAIKPRLTEALFNRGNLLKDLNRLEEALASYKKASAILPNYAEGYAACGDMLSDLKRPEEALARYKKAAAIRPDFAEAHIKCGDMLKVLGRPEEALASYDSAIAVRPDFAEAHDRRGLALMDIGRLTEARSAHENAIKLAPRSAPFYYNLTELTPLPLNDPHVRALKSLARNVASIDWHEQIPLHFALAKIFTDNGDYKKSFQHLLAGNALKREHTDYDEAAILADIDNLGAIFTKTLMHANVGLGDPSNVPVFVLGMPRSGSTLVEQILSSHPDVFGAGEVFDFVNAAVEVGGPKLEELDVFSDNQEMLGEQLRKIGSGYVSRIGRAAPRAKRIVNKMPDNFRLIGLINLALPNARIIHTMRDPIDTCVSCFSKLFENLPFTHDLGELGRYYRAYAALMAHWREVLPPNVMLDVQYEDVVGDIERQARSIVAHCGLEWDARCLDFHLTERVVRTASAVQVRQPVNKNSVERWRNYEPFLEPLLSALGPSITSKVPERAARSGLAGRFEKFVNIFKSVAARRAAPSPER